ncbi:alpha/beta hydrolase [Nocardioides sp. Bht2]|uniref:alpha/beta hydrolase n=1 Tax=Nocardioides sp. Bht2 TaxID=3392297 RepID=UPI0039B55B9D
MTSGAVTQTDPLGADYTQTVLPLPDDAEGPVVATLVHRRRQTGTSQGAVLHVHGFADYFFQTPHADWWVERGWDFYALDLRKYGRSLLSHQTANYVADLAEYFPELDAAWRIVRSKHEKVVLSAHSTGGLTVPLWLQARTYDPTGMVLNSPWLDMQGPWWMRTIGTTVIKQLGSRQPMRQIPRSVSGLYARSLHRDYDGEFEFNLDWKPLESWPVHAGWLRAIRSGHAQIHRGLSLRLPILVLSSLRSATPSEMGEEVHTSDIVLDVEQIRRWVPALGTHITSVAIPDARHDVWLSRAEARAVAFDELERWTRAYQ